MCRFSSGNWLLCTKFVQSAVAGKGTTQVCTSKKECTKLDLTAAQYFWLVDHNGWSRWFATSSSHIYVVYLYKRISVCPSVRYPIGWNSVQYPIGWKTQGNGYHSVSGKITQCDGYHSVSGKITQCDGYHSVSGKITQCDGYHSVSGLFVRKTGSLSAMGITLGWVVRTFGERKSHSGYRYHSV